MEMVGLVKDLFLKFGESGQSAAGMLHMFTIPLKVVLKILTALGPGLLTTIIMYKVLNKILPMNLIQTMRLVAAKKMEVLEQNKKLINDLKEIKGIGPKTIAKIQEAQGTDMVTMSYWRQAAAQLAIQASMFIIIGLVQRYAKDSLAAATGIGVLVGMLTAVAVAMSMANTAKGKFFDPATWIPGVGAGYALAAVLSTGAVVGGAIGAFAQKAFKPPDVDMAFSTDKGFSQNMNYAMGGIVPMRHYASGGRTRGGSHFPVMVEGGETIIPKTQNMLGGGGVTVNVGDVYAQDGTDFAQKLANELPRALRMSSYRGAF